MFGKSGNCNEVPQKPKAITTTSPSSRNISLTFPFTNKEKHRKTQNKTQTKTPTTETQTSKLYLNLLFGRGKKENICKNTKKKYPNQNKKNQPTHCFVDLWTFQY